MQFNFFSPRQACFCFLLFILPGMFLPGISRPASYEKTLRVGTELGYYAGNIRMKKQTASGQYPVLSKK